MQSQKDFVRAGWTTHGLVRSASGFQAFAVEEILPIVGSIEDWSSHHKIGNQLPPTVDSIVFFFGGGGIENWNGYASHYNKSLPSYALFTESALHHAYVMTVATPM